MIEAVYHWFILRSESDKEGAVYAEMRNGNK